MFSGECKSVSAKFSLADRRSIALRNLSRGRAGHITFPMLSRTWRRCVFVGVPCECRLVFNSVEDYADGSKKLSAFCTELKCNLTDKRA